MNLTNDKLFEILAEIAANGNRFCRIAWKTAQKAGGVKFTLCTVQANVNPENRNEWERAGGACYYTFTHGHVLAMHKTNGTRYVHLCKSTMKNRSTYELGAQDTPRPHGVGSYDGFVKKLDDVLAVTFDGVTYTRTGEMIPFVL